MIAFGERLRALRKAQNLTQKQLADLIGVKNRVISFYEVGDRIPSPEVLVKLASALRVSTDALLGLEKGESVDISDLSESDKVLVRMMVLRLRNKE